MSWIGFITKEIPKEAVSGAPCPYFRKTFCCEKGVAKGILKISSLGVNKSFLNGEEVDNDILAPGWTTYNKRIPYYEIDITDRLKEKNTFDVILSDGWYVGRICWSLRDRYGTYPLKLWVEICIEYKDGTTEKIETDETWQVSEGPIRYGDILAGEYVDFRQQPTFDKRPLVLVDEYSSLLEKADYEHVKKVERIQIKRIKEEIWDTEQNFAGIVRMICKGKRGTKIRLRYAELLDKDGKVYTENLRNARCTDYVVLSGEGEEIFEPYFTYHGFRYVETVIEEGEGEILSLEGIAVHNDLVRTGEFSCSNELVNKIYENTVWGMRSNFVSTPTDCPQRDERLGWTADAQVFCSTAMYLYDCNKFYQKYMNDIRDGQGQNGEVYNVAPVFDFKPILSESPAWGDAVTVVPYQHYLMYGDKKILVANIGACKKWVDYCYKKSFFGIRRAYGFGDWLSIGNTTNKSFIATCYLAYSAYLVSVMCKEIEDDDEQKYQRLFEKVKRMLRLRFFHRGKIANDTQTCYVLSYVFGLAGKEEVKDNLIRKIEKNDGLLNTGFIGTRYLLPVLCEIGRKDLAYRLIAEKRFPSWGYTIANGATTIWERWDGYRSELKNPFQSASMNSYNHYSFGACTGWMFEYVLGLVPTKEEKRFVLRPYIDTTGVMTYASGKYRGIEVSWEVKDKKCTLTVKQEKGYETEIDLSAYRILSQSEENNKKEFILGI